MTAFTDAQRKAIDASGNVLVSAGAGTGKTRTVVERCLRLIGEGVSLENILMVTFTEAAAAEMRARLRKALERMRSVECGAQNSDKTKCFAIEEQLALLDTAHISTLHSFCLELVRDHFHELHLDPQVSVLDERQSLPLAHETLDALLQRCHGGGLSWAANAQQLIRQYGGGSDERIRRLILKLHRYAQSLPPQEAWYDRELARLSVEQPGQWRAWLLVAFQEWRTEWLPILREAEPCNNLDSCVRALTDGVGAVDMAATFRAVNDADETDWPKGRKTELRKPLAKFFEEAHFLRSLVEPRDDRDPLADDWNWMRVPMRTLLLLTKEFTKEFTKAKRALGGVDFADLEQLALQLLVNERGESTDVARAWQAKFVHVFVDECQDINAAQDAIIRAVSREDGNRFLVGDVKQSIYSFRLADPKIFRRYEEAWRGGQAGQRIPLADNFRSREAILNFINPLFAALMRPSLGGVAYDEDASLRFGNPEGRAPVASAPQAGPRVELHVIYKAHPAENGEVDRAEFGNELPMGSEAPVEDILAIEKEARLVARRLHELRARGHEIWDDELKAMRAVEWRDMVVLLRSPSARVETFAKEFSRAGVPLAAARAGFFSAVEVLDLLNLLRLLDNPLQDIPLAAVLRSPLVGLSADELAAVRIESKCDGRTPFCVAVQRFLQSADCRPGKAISVAPSPGLGVGATFGETARAKLKKFFAQFSRWRALARQTSLSHGLETVLAETHYEALLLAGPRGRERVANVNQLLELARQYDPFQRQGLYRFLRFVTEQEEAELDHESAVVETADAVRLMSIHKSKGLEFPVVVLASLAGRFNTQDLREDILLSADHGLGAKIFPPHVERRYPSLAWWLARRREALELAGEEMRLLYVAMTRARDTLILTAFDKGRHAGERWHAGGAMSLRDRDLTRDNSCYAWLRRWLAGVTTDLDWSDDHSGQNRLLSWELHSEDKREFTARPPEPALAKAGLIENVPFDLEPMRRRLAWSYPFTPLAVESAKTSVSVLRRRATDEESRVLFRPRPKLQAELSAANVGSAHHTFLQFMELERAGTETDLRNEAERLVRCGSLAREEAAVLEFDTLLRFWQSPAGRGVLAEPHFVHRELPFTARFTLEELAGLGLARANPSDEFVIVQGVVDMAILRPDSISILDFKTDRLRRTDLAAKTKEYEPQLRLYASALTRIYARPVKELALHFLSLGETSPISVNRF